MICGTSVEETLHIKSARDSIPFLIIPNSSQKAITRSPSSWCACLLRFPHPPSDATSFRVYVLSVSCGQLPIFVAWSWLDVVPFLTYSVPPPKLHLVVTLLVSSMQSLVKCSAKFYMVPVEQYKHKLDDRNWTGLSSLDHVECTLLQVPGDWRI